MKKKTIIIICIFIAAITAFAIIETSREASNSLSSEPSAPAPNTKFNYQKLIGSWIRQTGGYVIAINKMSEDGQIYAEYFNPRPIHVSEAIASEENGALKLFIELRDQGYPGSTYTLRYNPEYDALVGVYFQAAMQQSFDVAFTRKK